MKNKHYALIIVFILLTILMIDFYVFEQSKVEKQLGGMAVNVTQQTGVVGLNVVSKCAPPFLQGWNLFSICAIVPNASVEAVLTQLGEDYRYVMEWDEDNQDFLIYSPRAAVNPFYEFNLSKSYFIYYKPASGLLSISGSSYDDVDVFSAYGWDVPFYPYTFTSNVSGYLDALGEGYRYMMKWDAGSQAFDIYSPRAAVNIFDTIDEGEGQYLYVNLLAGEVIEYNKSKLEG